MKLDPRLKVFKGAIWPVKKDGGSSGTITSPQVMVNPVQKPLTPAKRRKKRDPNKSDNEGLTSC